MDDNNTLNKQKQKIRLFEDHTDDEPSEFAMRVSQRDIHAPLFLIAVLIFDEGLLPQRFVDFAHGLCAAEQGSRRIELRQLQVLLECALGQDVQATYTRAVEALRSLTPTDHQAWQKAKAQAKEDRDESYRRRRAQLDARCAAAHAEWLRNRPVVEDVLRGGIRI